MSAVVPSGCPGFDVQVAGSFVLIRTPGQFTGHQRGADHARALAAALNEAADQVDDAIQNNRVPLADATDEMLLTELAGRGVDVKVTGTRPATRDDL